MHAPPVLPSWGRPEPQPGGDGLASAPAPFGGSQWPDAGRSERGPPGRERAVPWTPGCRWTQGRAAARPRRPRGRRSEGSSRRRGNRAAPGDPQARPPQLCAARTPIPARPGPPPRLPRPRPPRRRRQAATGPGRRAGLGGGRPGGGGGEAGAGRAAGRVIPEGDSGNQTEREQKPVDESAWRDHRPQLPPS